MTKTPSRTSLRDALPGGGRAATARTFTDLPAPQQAGILCNDPQFQSYAAIRSGFPGGRFAPGAAAEYLRQVCGITSRRHLDTNARAREQFDRLRTDFDAWRGRIAAPQP